MAASAVWVALTGKIVCASVLAGFWPVNCVVALDWLCRLQAERTATSASDIERNLNGFNVASMIVFIFRTYPIIMEESYFECLHLKYELLRNFWIGCLAWIDSFGSGIGRQGEKEQAALA